MERIQDLRSLPKRLERLEQFERLEPRLRNHGVTVHIERISQVHPGRILLEEFLAPRGISVWHLAKDIGVPARRIYEIVQGQRPITSDIAHRLAHYFGMSERHWLDLQARYDQLTQTLCLQGPGRPKRLTNSPQISDTHSIFHNEARKS